MKQSNSVSVSKMHPCIHFWTDEDDGCTRFSMILEAGGPCGWAMDQICCLEADFISKEQIQTLTTGVSSLSLIFQKKQVVFLFFFFFFWNVMGVHLPIDIY